MVPSVLRFAGTPQRVTHTPSTPQLIQQTCGFEPDLLLQIHFWNSTAITYHLRLCGAASCLLGVWEKRRTKIHIPKSLCFIVTWHLGQRTQTRWIVSTDVLYPWYTVEAFILGGDFETFERQALSL